MRGRKNEVVLSAAGERVRDPEGRWTATGDDVVVRAVVVAAPGAITRRRDLQATAGHGEHFDGIVLLDRGTPFDSSWRVFLDGGGDLPGGEYRVRAVTRTHKHVRVAVYQVAER